MAILAAMLMIMSAMVFILLIAMPVYLPGGVLPPRTTHPEKRLRRARWPASSSPSGSTRKATPNPPDEA
eukprot:1589496-Alexandrium_andersonii.AAC.1